LIMSSADPIEALPVCRVCGCTDSAACTWSEVLGDGQTVQRACSWAADDLCSECVGFVPHEQAPEPLLYDAAGRPVSRRGAR
jgi:hypothetical protein